MRPVYRITSQNIIIKDSSNLTYIYQGTHTTSPSKFHLQIRDYTGQGGVLR